MGDPTVATAENGKLFLDAGDLAARSILVREIRGAALLESQKITLNRGREALDTGPDQFAFFPVLYRSGLGDLSSCRCFHLMVLGYLRCAGAAAGCRAVRPCGLPVRPMSSVIPRHAGAEFQISFCIRRPAGWHSLDALTRQRAWRSSSTSAPT